MLVNKYTCAGLSPSKYLMDWKPVDNLKKTGIERDYRKTVCVVSSGGHRTVPGQDSRHLLERFVSFLFDFCCNPKTGWISEELDDSGWSILKSKHTVSGIRV